MKKLLLLPALLLSGCGSFPLGYVQNQPGKTVEERDAAMLVCKDRAKNEANTDARVAGSFLAGLTIVGAPIAIAAEREKQREVFAKCMGELGYAVRPPN
jgi:hypothetical protein